MKFNTNHKSKQPARKGFTLIELLVVMGIIATLAAVSVTTALSFLDKGKYTETRNMCNEIQIAIDEFESEYSHLPYSGALPNIDATTTTDASGGIDILNMLMARETGGNPINDKAKVYFTTKTAKNGKNGLNYNGDDPAAAVISLLDHWGNPFTLLLDYDDSGTVNPASIDAVFNRIQSLNVIIATPGKDRVWGEEKDITSWNN